MPRYPHYPGVGKRIKQRVGELGFPSLNAFIRAKKYDPRYFYEWANRDRTPTGQNLDQLAADLKTTRGWLLFGEGKKTVAGLVLALTATLGVLLCPGTTSAAQVLDSMRLISTFRRWAERARRGRFLAMPVPA